MSRHRHPIFATLGLLAAAILLVLAPAASAKSHDRNHDGIPDRWETKHHLSLKVNQAHRDQDHDGLNNLGEFKAGTDPRDADTDNNGVKDGDEHAGTVVSFTGGKLTIRLAGSTMTVEGTVDAATEMECGDHQGESAKAASIRSSGGDQPGTSTTPDTSGHHNDQADANENEAADQNEVENENEANDNENANANCTTAALKPGAVVREAELTGTHFDKIELGAPAA